MSGCPVVVLLYTSYHYLGYPPWILAVHKERDFQFVPNLLIEKFSSQNRFLRCLPASRCAGYLYGGQRMEACADEAVCRDAIFAREYAKDDGEY